MHHIFDDAIHYNVISNNQSFNGPHCFHISPCSLIAKHATLVSVTSPVSWISHAALPAARLCFNESIRIHSNATNKHKASWSADTARRPVRCFHHYYCNLTWLMECLTYPWDTLHVRSQWINVLKGEASWRTLCRLSHSTPRKEKEETFFFFFADLLF